jgi:regulator of ribonuclease activity A
MKTADLTDQYSNYQLCDQIFSSYGGIASFHGPVRTVKTFEDFSLVLKAVSEKGRGSVLVIDGGGSRRCAMFGDRLAKLAVDNEWAGIIIFGLIRDSAEINRMPLGVRALGTTPIRSAKEGLGTADVSVRFAGVTFDVGSYVYADEDGIIVSPVPLNLSK